VRESMSPARTIVMLDVVDIAVSRFVSAAAKLRLTACDGMNPQDFALLAHDSFEAFTGRHGNRLRAGLDSYLGNHCVVVERNVRSLAVMSDLPRVADSGSSVEQQSAGLGALPLIMHRFSELSMLTALPSGKATHEPAEIAGL
jgi:hypothetical protein